MNQVFAVRMRKVVVIPIRFNVKNVNLFNLAAFVLI